MSNSAENVENAKDNSAGAHSLAEIISQPECWKRCLDELDRSKKLEAVRERFTGTEWLFIGCGSSYYAALSAAATMTMLTGQRAQAIPASEILFGSEFVLSSSSQLVPVLISRSGRTSEVLRAAELLKSRGVPTLAITCATQEGLERLATATIVLPAADEKSTVMTHSFSSMLLALQQLAATVAGDPSLPNRCISSRLLQLQFSSRLWGRSANSWRTTTLPTMSIWPRELSMDWPASEH